MSDHTDHDRRTVLKSLTAATVVGIGSASTAVAASDADTEGSEQTIPFDMKVTNRASTGYNPTVRVVPATRTSDGRFETAETATYEQSFSLPSVAPESCGTASVTEATLGIEGDRQYEVQLTSARHDETETMVFGVPPGGVPGYAALVLDISPSDELRAAMIKD